MLEPRHQIVSSHIRTLVKAWFTHQQRCSRCIILSQPTELLVHFAGPEWSRVSFKGNYPGVYSFDEISAAGFVAGSFLVLRSNFYLIFSFIPNLLWCLLSIFLIIIMSHHQPGYPWPFLVSLLYRPLLLAGLQDYIPYQQRATVYRF